MTDTDFDDRYQSLVATDTQTCYACPTQWEGRLHDGRHFYFRYRHGWASLAVGYDIDDVKGRSHVGMEYGDHLAGVLDDSEYHRLFLALLDQMATETSR